MPNRLLPLLLLLVLFLSPGASSADIPPVPDGYVKVALEDSPTVSGKAHAIAAYSIVLAVLAIYSGSLLIRQRKISKGLERLREKTGQTS